jgi:hypothetical protein|nr:MAG TPA: hypothetical protein [Caudoviricetes sp.]
MSNKINLTDANLLADLQKLIEEKKKAANPSEDCKEIVGTLTPIFGKLMPMMQKKQQAEVDTLTRVRNRLAELLDE